jgi:hypothetical protein
VAVLVAGVAESGFKDSEEFVAERRMEAVGVVDGVDADVSFAAGFSALSVFMKLSALVSL